MSVIKLIQELLSPGDGPQVKTAPDKADVGRRKNEFYHKETGRRHFAENTRRWLLIDTIKAYRVWSMFKQNEKSIAQIAEYIPRACRGMQLQGS